MKMIPLDQIGHDMIYYPRVGGAADWVTVHRYSDSLKANPKKEFPPIVVTKVNGYKFKFLLLDGLHRVGAYYNAGRTDIPAEVETLPKSKWLWRSTELNVHNGRPLGTTDKAFIIMSLKQQGYVEDDIAGLLEMPIDSLKKIVVENVRRLSPTAKKNIPEGTGNRKINGGNYGFLKAPFKGTETQSASEIALAVQGPISSHNIRQVLASAIAVLEAGVDMTDEEIVAMVKTLHQLTK